MIEIIESRLKELETISLAHGSHKNAEDGMCIMEAVSYVAGEPFSDSPKCASPIISAFLRSWNDSLNDEDRNRLIKPLVPLLVGTNVNHGAEDRRAWMILDWLIREFTPTWLRLAKLNECADAISSAAEIKDLHTLESSMRVVLFAKDKAAAARDAARAAAGDAAWAAAWAAARAAAGDAAWAAARAAARDAAGDAAWAAARDAAWDAAGDAARAAARDAAGDAAWDAAWAAAGDALKPTTSELQLSAIELIKRLCKEGSK